MDCKKHSKLILDEINKVKLTDIVSAIVIQITSLCMSLLVHTSPCINHQCAAQITKIVSITYLRCNICTSDIMF